MDNTIRERIALVIFIVLVALAGIVLTSYFTTGRTWTVAATIVDDRVGSLEGYTAIVYKGTIPNKDKKQGQFEIASDENESLSLATAIRSVTTAGEEDYETDIAGGFGLRILNDPIEIDSLDDGLFVSDVREIYEKKSADVLSLDISDPERYSEPIVLESGDKKIGVFYIDRFINRRAMETCIQDLKDRGATSIICITKRPAMISTYEGLDVVLLTSDEDSYFQQNRPNDGTLLINSPKDNEVGVIFFSSNNVPSARSIDSL